MADKTNEELVKDIQSGANARESLDKLYQNNRGFIYKIARKYAAYAEIDDLMQEAFFGLYEAARRFEFGYDVAFISYAAYWIRLSIDRYVKNNGTVRISVHMRERIEDYNKISQIWQQEYSRKPTDKEICYIMGISDEVLERVKAAACMARIGSLDTPVGEDGDATLYDLVPCAVDEYEQVLEDIQQEQLRAAIWPLVDALPENLPYIIRARYQEQRTFVDIARESGVTIEAIRQKEKNAMRILRLPRNARKLQPYLTDVQESTAFRGSAASFNRTWTSSTERAALM